MLLVYLEQVPCPAKGIPPVTAQIWAEEHQYDLKGQPIEVLHKAKIADALARRTNLEERIPLDILVELYPLPPEKAPR